jgi:hypothetical protein
MSIATAKQHVNDALAPRFFRSFSKRNSRNEVKTTIRSCIWTLAVVVDKVNYKLCTSVAHETSWPKFHLGTRLKVATIQDVSSSFVGLISSVAYMDRFPLYGLWASAGLMEIMIP